jgi:hypothetical protein
MSAIDRRMYYLMLSPSMGQGFAEDVGFSTPSEEVQEAETYEVISRWALLTSMGLLEEIIQCSDWFCDLKDIHELSEETKDEFHRTLVSHGVALVNKLLDSEKVILMLEDTDLLDIEGDDYDD